jgi:hypothetical protein
VTRVSFNGGIRAIMSAQLDLTVSGSVSALLVHAGTAIDGPSGPPINGPAGSQTAFTHFTALDEVQDALYARQTLSTQSVVPTIVPGVEVQARCTDIDFGAIAASTPDIAGILFFVDGATDALRIPICAYVRGPDFPPQTPDGSPFIVSPQGNIWWTGRKDP